MIDSPKNTGASPEIKDVLGNRKALLAALETGSDPCAENENLLAVLDNLERHFQRGIVVIDDKKGLADFKAALVLDKTAGTNWKTIRGKLLENGADLLKGAAKLQWGGELIGRYPDGRLCIIDGANEKGLRIPVIIVLNNANDSHLAITAQTPNREEILSKCLSGPPIYLQMIGKPPGILDTNKPLEMDRSRHERRIANYAEARAAVLNDGFQLPPTTCFPCTATPKGRRTTIGLIAAVEAVTGKPFLFNRDEDEIGEVENMDTDGETYITTGRITPPPIRAYLDYGDVDVIPEVVGCIMYCDFSCINNWYGDSDPYSSWSNESAADRSCRTGVIRLLIG